MNIDKERNETNVGSVDEREVIIRNTIYGDEINLAIKEDGGFLGFAYMAPRNAYALVDWITANVERPRVKTDVEIAFEKLEIGTVFGFYYLHEIPTRWPYKKVSETEYAAISEYGDDVVTGIPKDIKGAGSGTLPTARPVKPKLSVKDKIDALKIGGKFVINGGTSFHFIKTGETDFVRVSNEGHSQFYKDAYAPGNFGRWVTDFVTEVTEVD